MQIRRDDYRRSQYLQTLTDQQLTRVEKRIWLWLEKYHHRGSWDWPTLFLTYPCLAKWVSSIHREENRRWNA